MYFLFYPTQLKLIFVDILGRIQQWSGIVQNKLEGCKKDIELIRKELIARVCEINNKEREIAALKAQVADCELREKETARALLDRSTLLQAAEERPIERREPDAVEGDTTIGEQSAVEQHTTRESVTEDTSERSTREPAVQSSEEDDDRLRREIELKAEITQLRKENQRILKERADYENAIQRALLRGVSSLNVEALRVLRCPPIPCCSPCAPCPVAPEPVPCRNTKDVRRTCNDGQRNGTSACNASGKRNQGGWTLKRPCGSPCCSAGKNRKSTANSLLFLLHQGDAENVCGSNDTPLPSVCGSPILKKLEIPPCPRFTK